MDVESGVLVEPGAHGRRLVGAVVVADQVDVEMLRHLGGDLDEELLELNGAVPPVQCADDRAIGGVERPNRLVVPCRT